MAHFDRRRLIVGGKPRLVIAGETHYFRTPRTEWEDRIKKTRDAGCNAMATYIPWLFHEEDEGKIDVTGQTTPEHDLGAFIDLCAKHDLFFIARPGPFTMGEIKNEGLPFWIYTRVPECIPVTWGGKKVTSKTVQYNHPGFLKYVRRWYQAVMPLLAKRLDSKGGNVIALQLDNEIGMLQCWTEEADLSEELLCDFTAWLQSHYSPAELTARYPFNLADPVDRAKHLRDGTYPTARFFHKDYAEFSRHRFAQYARTLREYAEEGGVTGIPFVVNIHGSGGGRATTFPIGISQTFPAYTQAPDYWGSSDHYLGDITRGNVGDLYMLNAFMAAVNLPDQPLSSIEFEAGSGDYGESGGLRYGPAATDFKVRLSLVQGNRMLNHYLLGGGQNPPLKHKHGDGNDRLGTTGERHGFAAPIGPEGHLDPLYFALADTNHTVMAVEDLLAAAEEEHDGIHLGFVPDYYTTDVKRPGPVQAFADAVQSVRGPLEGMVRSMLFSGLSFTGVNLQADFPSGVKSIALASATVLDEPVQKRLLDFVHAGGNLLLYGRVPVEDHEGRPVTLLRDALGIRLEPAYQGSAEVFPSLRGVGNAAAEPEVRTWQVIPFTCPSAEPLLGIVGRDSLAGGLISYGQGKVMVVTSEIPLHASLWNVMFARIGVKPGLHLLGANGVILNRMKCEGGGRLLSLVNLDNEAKEVMLSALVPEPVSLGGRKAKLLPVGVKVGGVEIEWATAEITGREPAGVRFRLGPRVEKVRVKSQVTADASAKVAARDGGWEIDLPAGEGHIWVRPA
jgi:beta-galactosidase